MPSQKTWSIRYAGDEKYPLVSSSQEEAEEVAQYYRETGEHPDAVAYDRMAELLAAFPIGAKVRHVGRPDVIAEVIGDHEIYDMYPHAPHGLDRRYAASVRVTHYWGMSAGFLELLYRYHGHDVPMSVILGDLDAEIREDIPRERITVDGVAMIAVGSRLRLYWDAECGIFAADVRPAKVDGKDEVYISDEWVRAEWTPYTSNARHFAGNSGGSHAGWLANWAKES